MPSAASFESFAKELNRLVESFGNRLAELKQPAYVEAQLRDDFLNPLFRALGWDMENRAGLIQTKREVEIESRTQIGGGLKRADYLFRNHPIDRFVCEAKKPAEELHATYVFQAKRYAWNKGLPLAVLTDFEEMKIFIVGSKPIKKEPAIGLWRTWHFRELPLVAKELWDLLSRQAVVAGGIDKLIDSLPKKPLRLGKGQFIIKPDRSRALDTDFLNFLDEARRELASDLLKHNDRADLLEGTQLNEAVQRILDRLLFLRICEDRDIDTGRPLKLIVRNWSGDEASGTARDTRSQASELREEPPAYSGGSGLRAPKGTLWHTIVRHFRSLDRRPPSHIPFFNGNLFKPHFSEELVVGDDWLAHFLAKTGDEDSHYLFHYIPVEILGTIYERFLGKIVRPHGRGVTIEEKPEVRKAGGVYYTPRYIVEYIVSQTVGKLLAGRKPEEALKLRLLDPACGSGSFLIRAFEVVCEHCQQWLTDHPAQRRKDWCWLDEKENALHLTSKAKRRILRETIHGVDLDPQAVEVTQLSLYLKMLEGETRHTLARERDLFGSEEALLPPLENNVKCGNSLIASDFSMMPDDLVRVHAFDWPVQFPAIMKAGGFDAVIGNPPYILLQDEFRDDQQLEYYRQAYEGASFKLDTYHLFIERGIRLCRKAGRVSLITPSNFLTNNYLDGLRRVILKRTQPEEILVVAGGVFADVSVDNAVFVFRAGEPATASFPMTRAVAEEKGLKRSGESEVDPRRVLAEARALFTSGVTTPGSALWDRLSSRFPKLGDFADVNFGKQLRHRSKFTRDVIEVPGPRSLPRTHVACVTGKDVERYLLTWSKLACLNDTVAQCGGCWDESKHEAKGKFPTRQIGQFPSFAPDTVGYHCLNTIFMVTLRREAKIKPAFLLGILNSKLLRTLWTGRFYDQRQTFPKIKGTYLKELPVAWPDLSIPADRVRHDRLVGLVEKMLALTPKLRAAKTDAERQTLQNAVTATDQQIDALVYELYGLTEKEIQLVEQREERNTEVA
ncbi:MAG: N-6 DNA methylase [Verrucomicrobia bacterium]|nr:N-6 DNA methylase [Verrucomicrobiota bacterium]